MYFVHWISKTVNNPEAEFTLLSSHSRWIYELLVRVDLQLVSSEISQLRSLARACLALIKFLRLRASSTLEGGVIACEKQKSQMTEDDCWTIVTVITGIWAQRDLWMDAEFALA